MPCTYLCLRTSKKTIANLSGSSSSRGVILLCCTPLISFSARAFVHTWFISRPIGPFRLFLKENFEEAKKHEAEGELTCFWFVVALLVILRSLVFCHFDYRWLTKTFSNCEFNPSVTLCLLAPRSPFA